MDFEAYARKLKYYSKSQKLSDNILKMGLIDFYNFMNKIPYKSQVFEDVARFPESIIREGGDCGEKTKLCLIYFDKNKVDYKIIFQQVRPGKFHVFPVLVKDGLEYAFDTTYGVLKLGDIFNYNMVAKC